MSLQRDVTIYDIAEALNLSPATVSRGLKNHPAIKKDTKKRITEKARELGYQQNLFASNLRRNKTNTLGLIVPRLNSYFMSTVIAGIEKVANEAGYNLLISQSLESVKKEMVNVTTLYNSRVDGLLVSLSYDSEDLSHFDLFRDKKIPVIFFDRGYENPYSTNIVIDNYKAGYEVTQHLIDQGCKKIAHVTANLNCSVYADRYNGFRDALIKNKIPVDKNHLFITNLTEDAGINVARSIIEMRVKPDGIFATNDSCAVSCIRELKAAGVSIPGEIAIVGFNDDPLSKVIEPNLTTVHYPGQEMGEVAASMLIRRLGKTDGTTLNKIVLNHKLIIRQSSLRNK
jgi:LacI family transcriptional regulator